MVSLDIKPTFSSPWFGTLEASKEKDFTYQKTFCGICLEEFKSGQKLFGLPCEHVFHAVCLKDWKPYDPSCPSCREPFDVLLAKIDFLGNSFFFPGRSQQIGKKSIGWKLEEEALDEEISPQKRRNFLAEQFKVLAADLSKEESLLFFGGMRKIAQNILNIYGEEAAFAKDLTEDETILIKRILENEIFLKVLLKGVINFVDFDVLHSNDNASLVRFVLRRMAYPNEPGEKRVTRYLNTFVAKGVFAFLRQGRGDELIQNMFFLKHFKKCREITSFQGQKEYLKTLSWKEQRLLERLCFPRKSQTSQRIFKGISAIRKKNNQAAFRYLLRCSQPWILILLLTLFLHRLKSMT